MTAPAKRLRAAMAGLAALLALTSCGGDSGNPAVNHAPDVRQLVAVPTVVTRSGVVQLTALASDSDNDSLSYAWRVTGGALGTPNGEGRIPWTVPDATGTFRASVVVSDGRAADSAAVDVFVGSAALHVESNPPGAPILLNGDFSGEVTPHDFILPALPYVVSLASLDYRYLPRDTTLALTDGASGSASFRLPPVRTEYVDLGPDPLDEIGGLTYSRLGLGVLYAARRGAVTTLRSASLVPGHAGTNGRVLLTGVNWDESLSLRPTATGAELAFVRADTVNIGRLVDNELDGLMETLDRLAPLANLPVRTYAPSFNPAGTRLAFAVHPSSQPNGRDTTLVADYVAGTLTNPVLLASIPGNAPSLGPNDLAVFEASGEIFWVQLPALGFPQDAVQLTQSGRHAHGPAISPDGKLAAWIDDRGFLTLTLLRDGNGVRLLGGVVSGHVAWSPAGDELVIADNTISGNARLRLVTNLPLAR